MAEFKPGTAGNGDTSTTHFATQLTGHNVREAVDVNQPLELRADGLYKASGTGTFVGIAPSSVAVANRPLTPHGVGYRFHASDAGTLTVGATYYLGATAGYISDAATAKDAQGAFLAVSPYDLMVMKIGKLA